MKKEERDYMLHSTGLYEMILWLDWQEKNGMPFQVEKEIIYLNKLMGRFFTFGFQKKEVFLGLHGKEAKLFKLLKVNSLQLRDKDENVYFIISNVNGDDENNQDYKEFAIAIPVDEITKLDLIKTKKTINIREIFNDDNEIYINFHNKTEIPIVNSKDENIIKKIGGAFISKFLASKEQALNVKFKDKVVEVVGDTNLTVEAQRILQQYDESLNSSKQLYDYVNNAYEKIKTAKNGKKKK